MVFFHFDNLLLVLLTPKIVILIKGVSIFFVTEGKFLPLFTSVVMFDSNRQNRNPGSCECFICVKVMSVSLAYVRSGEIMDKYSWMTWAATSAGVR